MRAVTRRDGLCAGPAGRGRVESHPAPRRNWRGIQLTRQLDSRDTSLTNEPEPAAMSRPNILLISADQHRADCMGFAGRRVKTPHLDQLPAEGTHFANCITPNVVCQPARASILTGQLCRTHAVHDNGIDLDPAIGEKGFAGALAAAGYDTGYFGKAHFSTYHTFRPTGAPECLRSSACYPDDWSGPYMGFDHVELMLVGHNWWAPEQPPRRAALRALVPRRRAGRGQGRGDVAERRRHAWLGARGGDPFCAWVSFPDPHHPFDCPEPWSRLHPPDAVDLPQHRTRSFEGRPWWHKEVLSAEPAGSKECADIRKAYSRIPPQSDQQLREIIANTYGQIACPCARACWGMRSGRARAPIRTTTARWWRARRAGWPRAARRAMNDPGASMWGLWRRFPAGLPRAVLLALPRDGPARAQASAGRRVSPPPLGGQAERHGRQRGALSGRRGAARRHRRLLGALHVAGSQYRPDPGGA
ncbi:Choline-sulfatase [Candidatus Rhodobacter oscarellae]|uniref:Choline-sulfatase n=1 Tax=Candidatus Rhodobacter oscarellae TaxID=1675527 RepID=A0A0J9GYF8_9RHOB|nr:Choline-sulfatase [Candidatus Rhodobacter lobularis]